MAAQQLYELCETVGKDLARAELLPSYEQLFMDNEAEVRIASTGSVSAFCQLVGAEAASKIVPRVKDLAGDTSQHVRGAGVRDNGSRPHAGQGPHHRSAAAHLPYPAQG